METTTENKMGTKPVWSLLLTIAVPVILSTAAQSLYNIVDGIFVSMLGEDAMAAITFAGPCKALCFLLFKLPVLSMLVGISAMGTVAAILLSYFYGEHIIDSLNPSASRIKYIVIGFISSILLSNVIIGLFS